MLKMLQENVRFIIRVCRVCFVYGFNKKKVAIAKNLFIKIRRIEKKGKQD